MGYSNRGRARAGVEGENEIYSCLSNLPPEYIVYRNLLFRTRGGSTEIDILVVSPYGLFVIEVKRFAGKIVGSDADRHWVQMTKNGAIKPFYSPVLQNEGHLRVISQLLSVPFSAMAGLVCFAGNNFDLSDVNSRLVCTKYNLLERVLYFRTPIFNQQQISYICGAVEGANMGSKYQRNKHIRYVSKLRGRNGGF